jgi:hypothetical protein
MVVALTAFVGCGDDKNKVTAPDKFLPPTKPVGVGTGGDAGGDAGGSASAEVK